jgi:DNA ligase-1
MRYSELANVYEDLSNTPKRLEKIDIISGFLKKLHRAGKYEWIYLLRGKVLADYDSRELGISGKLVIKVISRASGVSSDKIVKEFNKMGDLGDVAEKILKSKKQSTLYSSKLTIEKVFDNLLKVYSIDGKGSVDKKTALIAELLTSASGSEAKYVVRTVLGILRVGVADSTIRDGIAETFFPKDKKEMSEKIEEVYDLSNDFAEIFRAASKGKKELDKVSLVPGKALNVMLPVKVTEIKEAFRICGVPCAIEHKYDGFRVVITKNHGEVKLFTRRLEEVTTQFPDVVKAVKEGVKGDNFIVDSEVVGYDAKTKKYQAFEAISQRIRRKYHIEDLMKKLPVEVNAFDVLFHNGKSLVDLTFAERRKILERIIKTKKFAIRTSTQIVTDSEKKANDFYHKALDIGEEGIMFKKLDSKYKPGRRVGHIVKMKPEAKDLDLVITAAEHGTGKRAGWLTSFIVACRKNGEFVDVGKVASGLKEKESEGMSYAEMTKILNPLIVSEKGSRVNVKPKIVVSVTYQNIQPSPTYDSGFAMRFPRITHYRPDRHTDDIADLKEIKKESKSGFGMGHGGLG